MIISNEPGLPWEYGSVVIAVTKDGKHLSDIMYGPRDQKTDGYQFWTFVVAGYGLFFYVNSHSPPDSLKSMFLSDEGNFIILKKDVKEIEFLHKVLIERADANKGRIL